MKGMLTNLRAQRINLGLSQRELEDKSKVPHWKITLAERGNFKIEEEELKKLSHALKWKNFNTLLNQAKLKEN